MTPDLSRLLAGYAQKATLEERRQLIAAVGAAPGAASTPADLGEAAAALCATLAARTHRPPGPGGLHADR